MAIKELQTRIALKYDSYANWTNPDSAEGVGKNLVLLKGEIGICEIPAVNNASRVAPTVLFKVGDGEKTFEQLPWASAKAADVHNWAKAETVVVETITEGEVAKEVLNFKAANGQSVYKVDLSKFAVAADVKETTDDLDTRIAAIEAKFGDDNDASVEVQLSNLGERLDVIEGEATVEGSIKKAAADALTSAQGYADQAELDAVASAKDYTDVEVKKNTDRIVILEGASSEQATAISNLDTAYKAADKAITDLIGITTAEGKWYTSVADGIEQAKTAADNVATEVDQEIRPLIAEHVENINKDISDLSDNLSAEATARAEADEALDARLIKVETFFEKAESETIDTALDTLVEIQKYITDEGSAADEMVKDIQKNAEDIIAIQNIVKDGGTLELRVDKAESDITNVSNRATALEGIVAGYDKDNTVKKAVEAAKAQADKGVADAKTAKETADKAQDEIDALELVVNDQTTGLAATKAIADQNKKDLADLDTRVGDNAVEIADIKAIVSEGDDSNAKLREAISALQDLTDHADKGNAKLRTDLDGVISKVDDQVTGLAATKDIADANADKIASIETNYLKAADVYVFNCGTSTTVVHAIQ